MLDFNQFEEKIKTINSNLRNKYKKYFSISNEEFRKSLEENVGEVENFEKLSQKELEKIDDLVGVDGSVNRCGGAYPHYIEMFQGLAKSTKYEEVYVSDIYTPTLNDSFEIEEKREKLLATIEIESALEYIKKRKPQVLMMDGGFIRYKINCPEHFKDLREICQKQNIILFGVIKDIKTGILARALSLDRSIYDRELLFNRFKIGQALLIKNEVNKKYIEKGLGEGFSSAFIRTSNFPGVVGIDILDVQENYLRFVSRLVYSLTPINSRGIPLWLDIVDKDVRITDELIKASLESYLDRDLYERFFVSERDKRTL